VPLSLRYAQAMLCRGTGHTHVKCGRDPAVGEEVLRSCLILNQPTLVPIAPTPNVLSEPIARPERQGAAC